MVSSAMAMRHEVKGEIRVALDDARKKAEDGLVRRRVEALWDVTFSS